MIAFIKGVIASKTRDSIILESSGIGYSVSMSASSISCLPDLGEEIQIHTYLQVREDAFSLFGFLTLAEKQLFLQLISVSSIGPKVALSALSLYSPEDLIAYVISQDIEAISQIPGVGKKTASRIVLELKGSLDKQIIEESLGKGSLKSDAQQMANEALLSMGFTSQEVTLALKDAPSLSDEAGLLQYALKKLGE